MKTNKDKAIEIMADAVEKWVNANCKKGEFEFYYNYFCENCDLASFADVVVDMIGKNIITHDIGFDYLYDLLK